MSATAKDPEAMAAAQLLVVQPGSRKSFRRRVMDALRGIVPATGAFCCFGVHDTRAYLDSSRLLDGVSVPMAPTPRMRLSHAFGFETRNVVTTNRRAYLATELYPDEVRGKLPYFAVHSVPNGFSHALLVFLHEGGVLFGLAGLERRAEEGPFTPEDAEQLEHLIPFIVSAGRAQLAYDELTREAAALRALGKVTGALFVIDRDRKKVVWAVDRQNGIDWEQDVEGDVDALVDGAEQMLAARARGDAIPTPMRLPRGTVVAVSKLEGDPVFGGARCAVVRIDGPQEAAPAAMDGLSRREREIARLLVAGYSGVNVAAISGLSENTVRTYVRRLYQKLDVSNRADLVRKLMSPEPKSTAPSSSQVSPPPDSSLVEGDDTLD